MTRIVAGRVGGRILRTPPGRGTRPTSEKVRAAIFDALEGRGAVRTARVLDLYAGSGALGLEAASRGAAAVVLVESDRRAAAVIRANAASLELPGVTVLGANVSSVLSARAGSTPGVSAEAGREVSAKEGGELGAEMGREVSAKAGGELGAEAGGEVSAKEGGELGAEMGREARPEARGGANTAAEDAPGVPAAFDLVLIDPPYDLAEATLTSVLAQLVGRRWLAEGAEVVVERSTRSPEPTWPVGLAPSRKKRYGETTVWFAEVGWAGGPSAEPGTAS